MHCRQTQETFNHIIKSAICFGRKGPLSDSKILVLERTYLLTYLLNGGESFLRS